MTETWTIDGNTVYLSPKYDGLEPTGEIWQIPLTSLVSTLQLIEEAGITSYKYADAAAIPTGTFKGVELPQELTPEELQAFSLYMRTLSAFNSEAGALKSQISELVSQSQR